MPRQDGGGAVKLLGQHDAGEKVGPGGAAEGEQQVGALARLGRMTIGRAEKEAAFAKPLLTPAADQRGEFLGGQVLPGLIEQHGLVRVERLGQPAAALGQLGQPDGPGDPLGITPDKLGLGRAADLAASDDVEENGLAAPRRYCPEPISRIIASRIWSGVRFSIRLWNDQR